MRCHRHQTSIFLHILRKYLLRYVDTYLNFYIWFVNVEPYSRTLHIWTKRQVIDNCSFVRFCFTRERTISAHQLQLNYFFPKSGHCTECRVICLAMWYSFIEVHSKERQITKICLVFANSTFFTFGGQNIIKLCIQ